MLRFYEFFPHTGHACVALLRNARAEAAKGVPLAATAHLHDFTFSLAAFLVVMGEYSYFGYSNASRWRVGGWPASAPAMSKPTTPWSRNRTANAAISRDRAA